MNIIDSDGPQTQAELSVSMRMTVGAVSRILAKLEDAGIVERHRRLGEGGSRGFKPSAYTLTESTRKLVSNE